MTAKKDKDDDTQDQGSLDQPFQPVDRIKDVPVGKTEGGPTNPVLSRVSDENDGGLRPQEADPTKEPDNSSAGHVAQANDLPRDKDGNVIDVVSQDEQGGATPAGTGTAAAGDAGT